MIHNKPFNRQLYSYITQHNNMHKNILIYYILLLHKEYFFPIFVYYLQLFFFLSHPCSCYIKSIDLWGIYRII
eukprot:UN10807